MEIYLNEIKRGFSFRIKSKSITIYGKITRGSDKSPYYMKGQNISIKRTPITTNKDLEILESLSKEEQIEFLKDRILIAIENILEKNKILLEKIAKGTYKIMNWSSFSPESFKSGGQCSFSIFDGNKTYYGGFYICENPIYSNIMFHTLFPELILLKSSNEIDAKIETFNTIQSHCINLLEFLNEI